jgi:hypothetical protein
MLRVVPHRFLFISCFRTVSVHAHLKQSSLFPTSQSHHQHVYDSVVTLAFALVTLTPSAFALARISTLFLAETAWEILRLVLVLSCESGYLLVEIIVGIDVLCGVGLVVHEEHVHVVDVVDEERLVAGRHHVASLLIGTVSDLWLRDFRQHFFCPFASALFPICSNSPCPQSHFICFLNPMLPPQPRLLHPFAHPSQSIRTFGMRA